LTVRPKGANYLDWSVPWGGAPGYMIRDCDRIYGGFVTRRLRAMGIRDKPVAPGSPCRTADRVDPPRGLGSSSFLARPIYAHPAIHLSLNKDAPISRAAENAGRIICRPILGGLHHQYGRM
jgi:hypothetical protein